MRDAWSPGVRVPDDGGQLTSQRVRRRGVLLGAASLAAAACGRAAARVAPDTAPTLIRGPARVSAPVAPVSGGHHGAANPAGRPVPVPPMTSAPPAQMTGRATVPVLCWHQLRSWVPTDSAYSRSALICPPARFREQLDALAAAGVTTIGPGDYLAHLRTGIPLPPRPVLLSFDDSQVSQITEGLPQLQQRQLTATFFVMTVVLGKPGWMSPRDLRRLRDAGMTVAAHTWDHHRADRYTGADWSVQLDQPRELLERLLRTPVEHFAYPYGAWSTADFPHLRHAGYSTAFQLSDRGVDRAEPLLTLRRLLVSSSWTGPQLLAAVAAARRPPPPAG